MGALATPARRQVAAVIVGALIGAASFAPHQQRNGPWAILGGMGALWLVGSFVVGQHARRLSSASSAGLVCLMAAVATYYIVEWRMVGTTDADTIVAWLLCGALAGPLLG